MAKQTFTTGQVLTAAQMTSLQQTAMGGGSPSTKTASYVLVAADAGTVIQMNSASATTITVNTALFSAGDSVQIQNIGAGVCTITAGTATVNTAGSLALSQWEGGFLYFTSASSAIFFDVVQSGGTPAFVGCSLTKTANQSISNATYTAVTFDSELKDTDNFHSTSSNTSRITIPAGKGGLYLITGQASFASNATGLRNAEIRKNGSTYFVFWVAPATNGDWSVGSVSNIIELAATDYIEMFVYQTSGGALNINGGNTYGASFQVQYLGA